MCFSGLQKWYSLASVVQGLGVLISASNFEEGIFILLCTGADIGRYFTCADVLLELVIHLSFCIMDLGN